MDKVILILFYFITPILIIILTQKNKLADKLGAIIIAYVIGFIIGNVHIIPQKLEPLQNSLMGATVALAIPLLLFSMNFKLWIKLIGKTFVSLILGLLAVVTIVIIGFYIFKKYIPDTWQISGLLVGLYSGGDPNLASLKTALNVSQERYIVVHASDLIFGAFFLLFILLAGKKTFESFLPKFKTPDSQTHSENLNNFADYKNFFNKKNIPDLLISLLLSMAISLIALYTGKLSKNFSEVVSILTITSLGLAFSFIPKIRNLKNSFQTGIYFILVFSLIVASMADFSKILNLSSLYIMLYVIFSVVGSIIIHSLLSKIFNVDADTMIISSIALVYSVPFIPVVASALKNKYLIVSGIIISLFGYAIGNYLGIIVAYTLK